MRQPSLLLVRTTALLLIFTVTASGFLVTIGQPLAGKIVLPHFGGDALAWEAVVASFSFATVLGFFLAWLLALARRKRWGILIVTAGVVLAFGYSSAFDWPALTSPAQYLFPFCVGVAVLTIAEVLLPQWFAAAEMPVWVDPFFVYGFVHLGLSLGLLTYLFFLEPWLAIREQRTLWLLGCAGSVGLSLLCAGLLQIGSRGQIATPITVERTTDRPSWWRRVRWTALAGLPGILLLRESRDMSAFVAAPVAWLLPVMIFQMTLVVAFCRMPGNRPSALAWVAQTVALLTCLPPVLGLTHVLMPAGVQPLQLVALGSAPLLAMIPHRSTLILQAITCAAVLGMLMLPGHIPEQWKLFVGLAAFALTCWGCHGAMVADRPSPGRLAEFLFFTGIAASVIPQFAARIENILPESIVFPSAAVLCLVVRLTPTSRQSDPQEASRGDVF